MRYVILLVLGLVLVGCPPTETTKEPAPADIGNALKIGFTIAKQFIESGETLATISKEPEFHPCMVADGSKAGLDIALANIDAIVAEADNPDGKITVVGGPVDFSRCMDMAGKPDPWPPTEPKPEVEAAIKTGVPIAFGVISTIVEPKIPAEGKECIKGKVGMAVAKSVSDAVTTTIIDAVNGKEVTSIPGFDVNYSGCGL